QFISSCCRKLSSQPVNLHGFGYDGHCLFPGDMLRRTEGVVLEPANQAIGVCGLNGAAVPLGSINICEWRCSVLLLQSKPSYDNGGKLSTRNRLVGIEEVM